MRPPTLLAAIATVILAVPALAEELTGADLLSEISGNHYDCKMGETPLEWIFPTIAPDAKTFDYTAIVGGKSVKAAYRISAAGRLSSDGYGDERTVTTNDDDSLTVARSDGRTMTCQAR